jgi:hypothetical protein
MPGSPSSSLRQRTAGPSNDALIDCGCKLQCSYWAIWQRKTRITAGAMAAAIAGSEGRICKRLARHQAGRALKTEGLYDDASLSPI